MGYSIVENALIGSSRRQEAGKNAEADLPASLPRLSRANWRLRRQQRAHHLRPLRLERHAGGRHFPAGARIPIAGIAKVALLAVQVGVDPGPVPPVILLRA